MLSRMANINRSVLIDLSILLALALIGVVGYKLSPLLLAPADITATPEAGCDLQRQACRAALPDGRSIELSIAPRPIPVVAPLAVTATLNGFTAQSVVIDFAGVTMNMGLNRTTLNSSDQRHFAGESTLPVCVTGRMAWQATALIAAEGQKIAATFLFDAPLD